MPIVFASDIQLPRDPTVASHAANKQYVDTGLAAKAATSHTHTTAQVTGLGTAATCNTGMASGNVPVLDTSGKLNISVIPALAITDTFVVATQAAISNVATAVPTGAAVYAHTNATSAHSSTATPTASRIAMWDANSRLKSAEPSATDDVATKNYVDSQPGNQKFRSTFTGSAGGTEFTITHNLNTSEVAINVFKQNGTTPIPVQIQYDVVSVNAIKLSFAVAPMATETYIVNVRAA